MYIKDLLLMISVIILFIPSAVYAEKIIDKSGIINDMLVSKQKQEIFYFENVVKPSKSWIHDTRILQVNVNNTNVVSNDLFIFPTEINEMGGNLIFAKLSDECIGDTMCDFQDIIIMSKKDGSYQKVFNHLKSAVHIATDGNDIYISESNGKIWKTSDDFSNTQLLYEGNNIIMDLAASAGIVYWIEEISDQNNIILMLKNGIIETIAEDIQIPYDIKVENHNVIWSEIRVEPQNGRIVEYTKFSKYDGMDVKTVTSYNNKTPLTSFSNPVYGPYLFLDDYIIITNNTSSKTTIHLIDIRTNQNHVLKTVDNYSIVYYRNSPNMLYVIGQDQDGFLVEEIPLPVTVPEFSSILIMTTITVGLSLTVVSRKIFHY